MINKYFGKVYIGTAVGYNTTTTTTTSKGCWFSGGSTTTASTLIPVFLQSELKAKRIGIHSQSIHIKGLKTKVDSLKLKAKEEIIFDSQTANMTQSMHTSSNSIFTKTSQGCGNSQEVEARNNLNVNKITANQKIKFINTDWDKTKTEIVGEYEEITKALKSDSYSYSKSSGLGSGKILPIIALAVSLACQQYQVGASFLSSLGASGTVLKMGIAGLSVLTTQAATNFIQTGDPVQTFKNLTSDRSLRQIAISVATAGVMDQVGLSNIDGSQSFFDHLKTNTIQGGISTGINLAISKDEPKDILKQGGLNIVANTVCGYGSSKIGANLGDNPIIQTMTHFVSGGTAGYILNQSSKGFMSGAIGATVAKMTMNSLQNSALEQEKQLNDKAKNEGKTLSFEERKANLKIILDKQVAVSQITSASVASLLNLDPDLASHMANTTATNNCEPASMAVLYAGWVLTSTYASMVYFDVMEIFEKEGVGKALEHLGWEGTICATTLGIGEIVKVGEKAFRIAGKLYQDAPQAWNAIKSQINKWGKLVRGERVKINRPTHRQSEIDISNKLGSKYQVQQSFKDGERAVYGSKDSVRPDVIKLDLSEAIEIKNYNLNTNTDKLINEVVKQAMQRKNHLPQGMVQKVVIDARGQNISKIQKDSIKNSINSKSNNIIELKNIRFEVD